MKMSLTRCVTIRSLSSFSGTVTVFHIMLKSAEGKTVVMKVAVLPEDLIL